jgi:hypothetical protein
MISWRRLRQVSLREWWLMARIAGVVTVLPILIRVCSVPRLLQLCGFHAPCPPDDEALVLTCVNRVLRRHPAFARNPCLKRSLTLYRFLGASATNLQICLGVRYAEPPRAGRRARRLAGHAWLVRNGVPYLEFARPDGEDFRVIYRHPTRVRGVA